MLDYYRGIDTKTGEAISYLQELSPLISKNENAEVIYARLLELGEQLEDRSTYGNETKDSKMLSQELPAIKQIFYSQETKAAYDQKLLQVYKAKEVTTISQPKPQIQSVPVAQEVLIHKEAPEEQSFVQKNLLFLIALALIFLGLLACVVFLNMSPAIILIFVLVLVVLYLTTM